MLSGMRLGSRLRQSQPRSHCYGDAVELFPAFKLEDADGRSVTDRSLRGHPAVIYLARHPG